MAFESKCKSNFWKVKQIIRRSWVHTTTRAGHEWAHTHTCTQDQNKCADWPEMSDSICLMSKRRDKAVRVYGGYYWEYVFNGHQGLYDRTGNTSQTTGLDSEYIRLSKTWKSLWALFEFCSKSIFKANQFDFSLCGSWLLSQTMKFKICENYIKKHTTNNLCSNTSFVIILE